MILDNETRIMLKNSATEWFKSEWPITKFRALRDSDTTVSVSDIWQSMVGMGWAGLCLGEDSLGAEAIGIMLLEAGKNLSASPLLSTGLLAASAINLSKNTSYIAGLTQGIEERGTLVSLAIDEGPHHSPSKTTTIARKCDNGWALTGRKCFVPFVSSADVFLIVARVEGEDELGLFCVEADCVERSSASLIDSVENGDICLNEVVISSEARLQSESDENIVHATLNRAYIGLSVEMLGIAESAFEMTIEYLKIREQFGELIGSFQALQHRAAKMHAEIELTRSVVEAALIAIDNGGEDLDALASTSKFMANETLHLVANETIQLHGGIGMTDEHDAGLYLKRARVLRTLYGSTAFHKDRFAGIRGF